MIVIFDTNIYRTLIQKKSDKEISSCFDIIKKAETKKNIIANASAAVGLELVSNILNSNIRIANSCLKATYAMILHIYKDEKLTWLSLSYNLLARKYFNFDIPSFYEIEKLLFAAMNDISENKSISDKDKMISKSIKKLNSLGEESFVNSIRDFIIQIDKTTTNWQIKFNSPKERKKYTDFINSDDFQNIYIDSMINTLKDYIPEEKRKGIKYDYIINDYKDNFKIPFIFRKNLMMRFSRENYIMDGKSRANYLWDEMILHLANQQTSNGERFMLVTEDKEMYKAVKEYDSSVPIYKMEEYLKMLGINL